MARSETIIVGGSGVTAGTPFTLGRVVKVVQVDPPVIGDTKIREIGTNTPDGASEILIPGVATNSLTLGQGVQSPGGGTNGIYIGRAMSIQVAASVPSEPNCIYIGADLIRTVSDAFKDSANATVLGSQVQLGGGQTFGCVAIGQGVRIGDTNGDSIDCIAIGRAARGRGGFTTVIGAAASCPSVSGDNTIVGAGAGVGATIGLATAIGRGAIVDGNFGVAVGRQARAGVGLNASAIAIGANAEVAHTSSMAFGRFCNTSQNNQVAMGDQNSQFYDMILGSGARINQGNWSQQTLTIRPTSAGFFSDSPNNASGWILRVASGAGRGNGAGSRIQLATPGILGSGSTAQSQVVQLEVLQSSGALGSANLRINNVANHAGVGVVPNITNTPNAAGGDPVGWVPIQVDFGAGPVTVAFPVWSL